MWFSLFLVFIFLIPFSFALNPVANVDLPILRVAIPILFLLWLFEGLLKKRLLIDTRFRFFVLFSFIFLALISVFWALEPSFSNRKIIYLISFLPLYFIGFAATSQPLWRDKIITTLSWSGFILSFFALLQFSLQFVFGIDQSLDIIKWYTPFFLGNSFSNLVFAYPSWLVNISGQTLIRAFASFPDPHLFSLYVNMLIPLALLVYSRTKKLLYFFMALLMVVASVASFSRASYFSLAGAFLFFIFSKYGNELIRKRFSIAIVFALLLVLVFTIPNPFSNRFFASFQAGEGSNYGRIEMWRSAVEIIKEEPLKGVGIGNFSYYLDPTIDQRNPVYAHNIILDFGSELGFLSIILIVLLIFLPILRYYIQPSPLNMAIAAIFVVFFVHSMFETPIFSVRVFSLFIILLSLNTND